MRARRLLPIIIAALVVPVLVPDSAAAGNRRQPIVADLNRDGLIDRATLGPELGTPTGTPNCTISVELRRPNGTYRPPAVRTYASPFTRQPFCPDMGEAINLGPLGEIELVLTHFFASETPTLLVLKNYKPVARFEGMTFPSTIRSEDFNGDGREDIWQSSDQTLRLQTFTNTGLGTLVPGPISACSYDSIPQHVLADFNGDGGQDFLVATRCQSTFSAQVLFGNGQPPAILATRTATFGAYQVFTGDINNDRIPDAVVLDRAADGAVTTRYFQNDGHGVFTEVSPAPIMLSADAVTPQGEHHPA